MTREMINEKLKKNKYRNSLIHKYKNVFIFIFMMTILFVPNKAYANMQAPVTDLRVSPISTLDRNTNKIDPAIRVTWKAPITSAVPDVGATLDPGQAEGLHEATQYEIYLQCVSTNGDYTKVGQVNKDTFEYTIDSSIVRTGLIYRVGVRGTHTHAYHDGDQILTKFATQVTEDIVKDVVTDPDVKTWAEGTSLYIEFDDAGSWVTYCIYYEEYKENPFEAGFSDKNSVARSQMTSSVVGGKAKLTYIINDSHITAGKIYNIAVKAFDANSYDDYTITAATTPKVYMCSTRAPFTVTEESNDFLKLSWKGLDTEYYSIDIFSSVDGNQANAKPYATIYKENLRNGVDYYLLKKPTVKTTYWIVANVDQEGNVQATSEQVTYDPNLINVTPGRTNIQVTKITDGGENALKLFWDPYYYEGKIYFGTKYDILVTDDVTLLANLDLNSISDYIIADGTVDAEMVKQNKGYTLQVKDYITTLKDAAGNSKGYTVSQLKENTVYYIRIIGKTESNQSVLSSDSAVVAFYLSTNNAMALPSTLPKPPLKKQGVTDKSATLEWIEAWYEMTVVNSKYNENVDWVTSVYVIGNHIFLDEEEAKKWKKNNPSDGGVIVYDISNEQGKNQFTREVLNNFSQLKCGSGDNQVMVSPSDCIFRRIEYSDDIKYEGFYLEETTADKYMTSKGVKKEQFLEKYLEDYTDLWRDIDVKRDQNYIINDKVTSIFDLPTENTSYWLVLRAYKIDEQGNKVTATMPTSLIITTTLKQGEIEPTPIVPTLILVETKDINTKFKWNYSTELAYEIRFSTEENVDTAEKIDITNEMIIDPEAPEEDGYYTYDLVDLFPQTGYYVWIKAKQVKGVLESAWSNPLMFITCDILPSPLTPPGGIGVASQNDAITDSHISVEWTRTDEDIELDSYKGTRIIKNISYVAEIADNVKFLDAKEIECGMLDGTAGANPASADFIVYDKTMFRALNLKSNTRYYVRIKTKIVVRDTKDGKEISKESPWSIIKIFKTSTVNEYDSEYGDIDVPVPEKLITVYNGNTVRINVNNDDSLINELIEQGLFDYTFDFSNEKDAYKNREAYIPLNVLLAFQNRDMNIVMKSKDATYSVNAKAFNNLDYNNLSRQGGVQGLVLTLNNDDSIYATNVIAKDIGAYFSTKYGDSATTYLEDYIEVLFDTTNSVYFSKNKAKGVVYDSKTKTWRDAIDYYTLGYNLILKTGKTGKVGISY
ncbi:MAG: hypothetical protein MJ245_01720 [Clostridia bacterium]|nr:hypothetical protein [Clostridia bacterium]